MNQSMLPVVTLDENGAALVNAYVSGGGGGGLGDYENVVVVAKSGAEYSTIITGEAACTSSDMLAVMPGVYNENFTIDVQYVSVIGFGGNEDSGIVLIGGSDDVGPIATLNQSVNITGVYFSRTLTGGAGAYIGVDGGNGSYFCTLVRCRVEIDGGSTGRDVTGVEISGDGTNKSHITNCRIIVDNEGSGEAVDLAGGDVTVEGSEIVGDVVCSAATTTRIRSTRIDGALTGTAGSDLYLQDTEVTGTISGWDNVYVEGAYDDPGASARTLATDANGLLTLVDLTLDKTDDGVDSPILKFNHDSASPAVSDYVGEFQFYGDDDGGNPTRYGRILAQSANVTDGSEEGSIKLFVQVAGTERDVFRVSGTEIVCNEDGQDIDARIEAVGESNALFVRGSDGYVGILTNTPSALLQIGDGSETGNILRLVEEDFDIVRSTSSPGGFYTATPTNGVFYIDSTSGSVRQRVLLNSDSSTQGNNIFGVAGSTDSGASWDTGLIVTQACRVGIGNTSPSGQLSIDQSSSIGAIPVLELDQADLSEEFINFISSVGDGYPIDNVNAVGTAYARLRVAVNGTFKYLQLYNA